jgi:predicted nucleic acid-binding protein
MPTVTVSAKGWIVIPADRALALGAAHVKAHHRLSYADASVVALAQQQDAEVVTGGPEFRGVVEHVAVRWLGPG